MFFLLRKKGRKFSPNIELSLEKQVEIAKSMVNEKWKPKNILPISKSGTATHGSLEKIKAMCEKILSFPEIVGISIATRRLHNQKKLQIILWLFQKTYLKIELGLKLQGRYTENNKSFNELR